MDSQTEELTMVAGVLGRIGVKRLVMLGLAAGVVALGLDSAVGHFLSGDPPNKPQWIPVLLAPVTFLLLLVALFSRAQGGRERWMLRLSGALNLLLGLAGTFFHVKSFFHSLQAKAFLDALQDAPPTFAPAGFAAVGLVALVLASPRLTLAWQWRQAEARQRSPVRLSAEDS